MKKFHCSYPWSYALCSPSLSASKLSCTSRIGYTNHVNRVTPAALVYGSKTTASDKSVEHLLATQLTSLFQNAAAAASSANQTDKVIIAPGLPAIPTKLLKKMHDWEYIELSQLLPQSDAAMDAQRFALLNFSVDWMKCFRTYVAAMAVKSPESVTKMLA